jgi:hypothetical protein
VNHEDTPARPAADGQDNPDGHAQHPVPPKPSSPPTAGLPRVPPARKVPAGATPAPAPEPPFLIEPPAQMPRQIRPTVLKAAFAVILVVVVGLLVLVALWLRGDGQPTGTSDGDVPGVMETSPTPLPSPLPLPREGVAPSDFRLGDCFKDFAPDALKSTIVACDTGHSAQLVAIYRYPATDSYPGAEALKAKALAACQAARLSPAVNEYTLNFERSYPSRTSWDSGDRRADCYVTADGGNVINSSVLP